MVMISATGIKNRSFYLWVGFAWLALWIGNTALYSPDIFIRQTINEVWRFFFIVMINYLFLEYSLPYIRKKRRQRLMSVCIGVVLFAVQLFLLSFGLYFWKNLGMALDIYTSFRHVTIEPDYFLD
jgi:hypothetical protein